MGRGQSRAEQSRAPSMGVSSRGSVAEQRTDFQEVWAFYCVKKTESAVLGCLSSLFWVTDTTNVITPCVETSSAETSRFRRERVGKRRCVCMARVARTLRGYTTARPVHP